LLIECGKLFGAFPTDIQQVLLLIQKDQVQASFFGLQQNLLAHFFALSVVVFALLLGELVPLHI